MSTAITVLNFNLCESWVGNVATLRQISLAEFPNPEKKELRLSLLFNPCYRRAAQCCFCCCCNCCFNIKNAKAFRTNKWLSVP